jgi:hypothetical protein
MTPPHERYRPPIKTKDGGRRGSVLGDGDTVVWVLGCRDEEIEWGVGYSTLKSPMTPPHKRYRPPIKSKDGGHRGSVLGEGDTVVRVLGGRDEEIERGVRYSALKSPMTPRASVIARPLKPRTGYVKGICGPRLVRLLLCWRLALGKSRGGQVWACKTENRIAWARFWSVVRKSEYRLRVGVWIEVGVVIEATACCIGGIARGSGSGLQN